MTPTEPRTRTRRLVTGEAPSNPDGVRALIEKLANDAEGGVGGGADVRLVPLMREAVTERVERSSLRTAAREIGMSPSGLRKFLDGNIPYTKTIHRLRRWYLEHVADAREQLSDAEAFAAIRVLVSDLPRTVHAETVDAMLHCMEQSYARTQRHVPGWVGELRARFGITVV